MHMPTSDPTDDRSAFIGIAVACLLALAGLVAADVLIGSRDAPYHAQQDGHRLHVQH